MTVVVGGRSDVPLTIKRLATLGYRHRGNLGIEDREAFDRRPDLPPHNLYVCPEGTIGLVNQLAVRARLPLVSRSKRSERGMPADACAEGYRR
jgi:hypothetical protein